MTYSCAPEGSRIIKDYRCLFANNYRVVDIHLEVVKGNRITWHYLNGRPIQGERKALEQYKLKCNAYLKRGYKEITGTTPEQLIKTIKALTTQPNTFIMKRDSRTVRI